LKRRELLRDEEFRSKGNPETRDPLENPGIYLAASRLGAGVLRLSRMTRVLSRRIYREFIDLNAIRDACFRLLSPKHSRTRPRFRDSAENPEPRARAESGALFRRKCGASALKAAGKLAI